MPLNSHSKSPYPDLLNTNPEKEQELYSSDLGNTKLYVLNNGIGKIKFICIEFDEKSKFFFAKKYNFDAFLNEKGKGKIFYLAIGVKENKINEILNETGTFLKLSISLSNAIEKNMDAFKQDKIKKTISHFKTKYNSLFVEYKAFEELYQAYDRQTGENVSDKLNILLNEKFFPLYKTYQEKEDKYGTQDVISLKKILDEGEKEYKSAIEQHQHYFTNTFKLLEKKFKDITDKFNNEIVQLENKNETEKRKERLDSLKAKVEILKHDCENTCHEDGLYSKKIIEDHNILTQNICFLLNNLNELKWKSFTEEEINGLEKKNNEYVRNLEIFKKSINDLTLDKANQDTEEDFTPSVNPLFVELGKLLDEIKIYKPSKGKEKIKENLEKEINNILEQQCNSHGDLINAINKADKFIKDNINEASSYTGGAVGRLFGKGQSILGELMHKLQELLGKFLELFPNHNFVSSMSSVSH
ncbi:MAG TPA: hypothetical protein VGH95_02960 [Candidatus Aquirickettsiella sp.]|jgi:hypothetical protein